MTTRTFAGRKARSSRLSKPFKLTGPIGPDDVLGAIREFDRYKRSHPNCDYEMRGFDDGSVFFRNTSQPTLRRLIPLAEIQAASRDFWMDPQRSLWQHIAALWL